MKPACKLLVGLTFLLCLAQHQSAQGQSVDSFNPPPSGPGLSPSVYSLAVQPDGKVLVGSFYGFARFYAAGTRDVAFNPAVSFVESIALQEDGKILAGGGTVWRLNPDGTADRTFSSGVHGAVWTLVVQPDGKLLVGGAFSIAGNPSCSNLCRLNLDGGLDESFNSVPDAPVDSLALQPDGAIIVGGQFTSIGGQAISHLARVSSAGAADPTFRPGASGTIYALLVQPNSKIIASGAFTNLAGQSRNRIGRLNPDGSLDTTFTAGADDVVVSIIAQADGKILVGGLFWTLCGQPRTGLGRLNPDGTLDRAFNISFGGNTYWDTPWINTLALQPDGRVLIGGIFGTIGGLPRNSIGRLNFTSLVANSLLIEGTTATWPQPGYGPEFQRVSFDASTNGTDWFRLGPAQRRAGSWQVANVGLPTNCTLRARGLVMSGSSSVLTEAMLGPPAIGIQPASRTNYLSDVTGFAVQAAGMAPLRYQWFRNGITLSDSGRVLGSLTPMLTISNVLTTDAAAYTVVITNGFGGITSAVANLFVIPDPVIRRPPASRTNAATTVATFSISASGSSPLSYRWFHDGASLTDGGKVAGSFSPTLTLNNVLSTERGGYWAVVANAFGTVTSAVATLTVLDPAITNQPASQSTTPGQSVSFGVAATGTPPLSYQWRQNGTNIDGATDTSLVLTNVQRSDCANYDVVVTNAIGNITSAPAGLTINFASADAFNPSPSPWAYSLAVQPDGKVLVGGLLNSLGGQPRSGLGRLNPDGTLDANFNPGANGEVYCFALQPDGKIVVGGAFSVLGGRNCTHLGRLNPDGTLDVTFQGSADGNIYAIILQPDGEMLIGGSFSTLDGQQRQNLGQLKADGTLTGSFASGADAGVYALALQVDAKVLVGGAFSSLAGQSRSAIGRLNYDGTLDQSFDPGTAGEVDALAVQPDGRIIVAGKFSSLAAQSRGNVGRLNLNGTLDTDFDPQVNGQIYSLALQADGRILLGGSFTALHGQPRNNIARLNPDGSPDQVFNPAANAVVYALALQADGGVLVCGRFSSLAGQSRSGLAGLSNPDPATQSLVIDGSAVTWLRGGSSPEVCRVAFDVTTNGTAWSPAGEGRHISGGWQLSGLELPTNAAVRAQGFATGGHHNGSIWVVEAGTGSLAISDQPAGGTYSFGSTAALNVQAIGAAPMSYQWLRNGTNLNDSGNVLGARTSTLSLTNLSGRDSGAYSVIVSNTYGVLSSGTATISVLDPIITSQPANLAEDAWDTATFNVTAAGTGPLFYQWLKNGTNLNDAGNVSGSFTTNLALTSVSGVDAGGYSAVVSGVFGACTSTVAILTVADPYMLVQPQSRTFVVGGTVNLLSLAYGTSPLAYQWRKAGTPLPDATGSSLLLTNAQLRDEGDYDVVVSNPVGTVTSAPARLRLNPCDSFNPGPGGRAQPSVSAMIVQPDGKLLVGGSFLTVSGQTRANIARLTPDGAVDPLFSGSCDGTITALLLQTNGKVVVAGSFSQLCGQYRSGFGRLNPDGSLDTAFNPGFSGVNALALQPDGKIVLAAGASVRRINPNGTVDSTLNASVGGGYIYCLALQPDGKLLIGGEFTSLASKSRSSLGRINSDGTLDTDFNPSLSYYFDYYYYTPQVYALAVQPDGHILVGGTFTSLAGSYCQNLGRLNANGSRASGFNPGPDRAVRSFAIKADASVLAAGDFYRAGGQTCSGVCRMDSGGALDLTFNPAPNGLVYSLAIEPDGKILLGGTFTNVGSLSRASIARLNSSSSTSETLSADDTSIMWQRSGGGPEFWRASFDVSTNGTNWLTVGEGQSVPGGWAYSGICLPTNIAIRARGFMTGGQNNGSGSYSEVIVGAAAISAQPASRTNDAGTTAVFAVQAGGTQPMLYQWLKNGAPLSDGPNVSGSQTSALTLDSVLGADAGGYSVIISNAFGSLTSTVARLTVRDPVITLQPVGQTANPGDTVSFSVAAAGTAPLRYQWRKAGMGIAAATEQQLVLGNVQPNDIANYDVVVTSEFGSITSKTAFLTFQIAPDTFNPRPDSSVTAFAVQSDGRILIGGAFTGFGSSSRRYIGRLNADGSPDPSFTASVNYPVNCLALQPDGNVLVGGGFSTNLARLSTYGVQDTTFRAGANGPIYCLAVQPDGKILLGGFFTKLNGQPRNCLGRLTANGALETAFASSADFTVLCLVLQRDGKILVGGSFTNLCGQSRRNLGRLYADGTLDPDFNPGPENLVNDLALQPDGRILVGGQFTNICGQTRNRIARLNPDGSLDLQFNPSASGTVSCFALQADGKVIIGGAFPQLDDQLVNGLARLYADGSPDSTFAPGAAAGSSILGLALQPDGKILLGGLFSSIGGQSVLNLARLNNTPAGQNLRIDGSVLHWVRNGTAPEIWRATFESSTNAGEWSALGDAQPAPGGWELTNSSVSIYELVRVRGLVQGHRSTWFVEQTLAPDVNTPPIIVTTDEQFGFQTGAFGFDLLGVAGQVIVTEVSTNLTDWTPVATNTLSSPTLYFKDSQAALYPVRFYRLRVQ